MNRLNILSIYRELFARIQLLDKNQKGPALVELREKFKAGKIEKDASKIESLVSGAAERLKFLRAMTPRLPRKIEIGRETYIFRNGEVVKGSAVPKGRQAFIDQRLDPEALERHNKLLKRQFFGKDPGKNPFGPF